MNKEIKKRWIEALRSGKYKQGRYCLTQIDNKGNKTYCCLGVLCDLAKKELPDLPTSKKEIFLITREGGTKVMTYGKANNTSALPREVLKWADLTFFDPPIYINNKNETSLTTANDALKYNFNQIADLIEAQL